jgi:hypothetical protein
MRPFLILMLIALASCQPRQESTPVNLDNPFLLSTMEFFRVAAQASLAKKDATALANQVFLMKRSLPTAWVAVVDASGTALMHSDPPAISKLLEDPLSQESLAYRNSSEPLVRRLWSADHRPILDLTLPLTLNEDGHEVPGGYVRAGFYAGEATQNWVAPPGNEPVAAEASPEKEPAIHAVNEASER